MKSLKKAIKNLLLGIEFSFQLLWKNERLIFLYLLISMLVGVLNSFLLILFPKYLLDNLTKQNYRTVYFVIALYSVSQLIFTILNGWINKNREVCSGRNRLLLKNLLFDKQVSLRHEQLEEPDKLKQYEFAQKCIDKGSAETCMKGFFSIVSAVVVISGVIYIQKDLPLWVLLLIVLTVIMNSIGQIVSARYSYVEMTEETPVERNLYYLRGKLMNKEYAKEIRAFQLSGFIIEKTRKAVEDFFDINQKYNLKHNQIFWWTHVVSGLQIFALYIYNVILYFKNKITVGNFTMNVSALFQFSDSLTEILKQLIIISEQSVYLRDYRNFLLLPSSYQGQKPVRMNEEVTIEFVDVSFRYPGQDQYSLEHISTTIHPGEKISIVGTNGAGKTTFIKLLLGLYHPTNGLILMNGIDIEELDPQQYMKIFSVVMQDYQLYSFTILDNLLFTICPTQDECDRARECIHEIGLEDTVSKLPQDILTFLTQRYNEDGIELSGGEHQKLAIARALYRNTQFIILDEPTSALSPQSEYDIYQQFDRLTVNKSVLFISHRLSSCTLCDRILVFDKGHIIEDGSHEQLLTKTGMYAQMFHEQSSLYGY